MYNHIGRLARDPQVFTNKNGSKTVLFTLYVDRDYTDAAGNTPSDAIPFEAYVPETVEGVGPYANIHEGDLIAVTSELRMDTYTDKSGQSVYQLKVRANRIKFLEPRSVTQSRLQAKQAQRTQAQNGQQAPAAAQAQPQQAAPANAPTWGAPAANQAPAPGWANQMAEANTFG